MKSSLLCHANISLIKIYDFQISLFAINKMPCLIPEVAVTSRVTHLIVGFKYRGIN